MGSQQVSSGGERQAAVLEDRRSLWMDLWRKLKAENGETASPALELLNRFKLVDERLAILFGDRQVKHGAEPEKPEAPGGVAERFKRYRIVG